MNNKHIFFHLYIHSSFITVFGNLDNKQRKLRSIYGSRHMRHRAMRKIKPEKRIGDVKMKLCTMKMHHRYISKYLNNLIIYIYTLIGIFKAY